MSAIKTVLRQTIHKLRFAEYLINRCCASKYLQTVLS